jgi:hypothetical protein
MKMWCEFSGKPSLSGGKRKGIVLICLTLCLQLCSALQMRSVMCISYCLHDWQKIFIILVSNFWTVDREINKIYILEEKLYIIYENVMWILGILRFKSIHLLLYTFIHIIHIYISNDSNVILKYFHFDKIYILDR